MIAAPTTRARLDLSGSWQLAFDPDGDGLRRGWTAGRWPAARAERVQVPAAWNVTHPGAAGIGYYRTVVVIPPEWSDRVVHLHVGGASYRTEAWVNGRFVGTHEGAYTAFRFDVSGAVRPGDENEIVLRIASLSQTGLVDGMALRAAPASKQSWYYAYGGLWGEVALEAVSPLFCDAIAVEPNARLETARFDLAVVNAGPESRPVDLALTVVGPNGGVAAEWSEATVVPPGRPRYSVQIPLPRPALWSCEQPNLYRVRAALLDDGEEVDAIETTFGMRDFTVRDGHFLLNEQPIYVKGALLQPNYPVGLVAPLDFGLVEKEIRLAKEAGFNMVRVHIRPAVPGLLDLTDRLGLLVYAETSLAWLQDGPRLLDHGRREVTALIERDRNHPSVVIWGIFNEHRHPAARHADALIRTARALDPTRVVLDNSGGTLAMDQEFGWADRATVVPNRATARVPFHDVHLYIGAPASLAASEWLSALGSERPAIDMADLGFGSKAILDEWYRELRTEPSQILVSELGCGGMADLDEVVAAFGERQDLLDARDYAAFRDSLHEGFAARGLDRIFGSVGGLVQAAQQQQVTGNRRQIEALLINPRVSGYILTQLNDVGAEFHAGVLDPWRRPKAVFKELQRLNRDRCLVLRPARLAVSRGEEAEVALTLVDRISVPPGGRIRLTVHDPAGSVVVDRELTVPPGAGIKPLGQVAFSTGELAGEYRVEARLVGSDPEVAAVDSVLALDSVDWEALPTGVAWLGARPETVAETWSGTGSAEPPSVIVAGAPASLTPADWDRFLAAVEAGAAGVIGPLRPSDDVIAPAATAGVMGPMPPSPAAAVDALTARGLDVQLNFGVGSWRGCYHWQSPSGLFAGLPADGLAGEVYGDVLPRFALSELGGEVLAGMVTNTETRKDEAKMVWLSEVEAVALGRGRLIFCQYRIFDRAGVDPVARRLLVNLLGLAAECRAR